MSSAEAQSLSLRRRSEARSIARSHRNIFDGVAREHSRKPEEGYEYARTYMPHARRAYLFSREHIDGFDCWGNEVDKYDLPLLKAA